MEQKLEETAYLINVETDEGQEEEEELLGGLQRRRPRPTKNFDASTVPANLVPAGISKASSSDVSAITSEEQEPEPEPEPGREHWKQHGPDRDFEVNANHLVSNVGPADGDAVAAAGAGDRVVADGNDRNGVGEFDEQQLLQSVSFEKEQESAQEHQEAEHGDGGFIVSKTDLINKYDLTAKKPNGKEDLIENFHEIRDHDVGISVSWKASIDDSSDLTEERCQESLSPLNNEHDSFSGVRLSYPRKSFQEETAISLIEEVEPQETEYDVEKVLEKQNTHELICPNCHSCITRKVILQRKRRRVPRFRPGARGGGAIAASMKNATESVAEDQSPNVTATAPLSNIPTDVAEDNRNDREPEVFRCLSCCTFFIPIGDGFKRFWIFDKRRDATSVPEAQEVPAAVATGNSFFSFLQRKKKPAVLEGFDALDTTLENKTEQSFDSVMDGSLPNQSTSVPTAEGTDLSKQLPSVNGAVSKPKKVEESSIDSSSQDKTTDHKEQLSIIADQFSTYWEGSSAKNTISLHDTATRPKEPLRVITDGEEPTAESGQNHEDAVIKPKPAEGIAPSVTVVVGQTIISIDQKSLKESEKDLPVVDGNSTKTQVSSPSDSQSSTTESKAIVSDSLSFSSKPEYVLNDAVKEPEEPTKNNGDSVIVTIERAAASQTTPSSDTFTDVESPLLVETQPLLDETRTAELPEAHDFDILKSIIYGGLIESIASLGVVSSAAGGGAATLNTLALALANLISGLFVLVHNLRELKNEQPREALTQTDMEEDGYYQQLGRRGKFSLHATVAVISYLVFGLVPPITYGFSFRKSDDRDYKLAAVAASSLLCILFLSLGKAHVRSKSYIKTAIYYLMMGFAASGISFLVGELVDKLLERLGLLETGSSSASVSGVLRKMMHPSGSGWASY